MASRGSSKVTQTRNPEKIISAIAMPRKNSYILDNVALSLLKAIEGHDLHFEEGTITENPISLDKRVNRLYYSNTAVLSGDKDGLLNFYNPAASRIFGYSVREAIGMDPEKLVPRSLRNKRSALLTKVLEKKVIIEFSTKRLKKSGEKISVYALIFPYELEDETLSIGAFVRKL